jgi:hypothetical protein
MAIFRGLRKPDDPFYRRSFLIMHPQPYGTGGKKPGTSSTVKPPAKRQRDGVFKSWTHATRARIERELAKQSKKAKKGPTMALTKKNLDFMEQEELNYRRPPEGHPAAKQPPKNDLEMFDPGSSKVTLPAGREFRDRWLARYPPGHAPFPMQGDDPPPEESPKGDQ